MATVTYQQLIAVKEAFAAHRSQIIGAARRAPRDWRIWAVVDEQGEWDGIYGPHQRNAWPARVHHTNVWSLTFSADPFMSRATFDERLDEAFNEWVLTLEDQLRDERADREMMEQYS